MDKIQEYINKIEDEGHRQIFEDLIFKIKDDYPNLELVYKWNQPMFITNDTFILGITSAKKHFSLAPEEYTLNLFLDKTTAAGYKHGKKFIQVPWDSTIDYSLIKEIIDFNISDKEGATTFWRA